MFCLNCQQDRGFLFRGLCVECAPELHKAYHERNAYWAAIFERFKKEIGIEPLQDWMRFESWMDAQGIEYET